MYEVQYYIIGNDRVYVMSVIQQRFTNNQFESLTNGICSFKPIDG